MADYVLSAELSLKDRFTAKISSATSKTHNFINKMKAFDDKFKKIENRMNDFSKKLDQATSQADKLKNKLDDTQKKFDKFGTTPKLRDFKKDMDKALEKIDQTKVKFSNLGSPLKAFEKGFTKSVNLINKVTGKLWKLTKWGVIGGTGLGIGALKIGADFETLKARMVTAFKGNEKQASDYYKWANQFANLTPFSNEEVIDATVRLQAYGYDPKRMMTMLGDFAGANGKTLEQAIEAYADASRKEFERLKEFAITKDEVLKYARETLGDPVPMKGQEITNMDKFMKALDKLIKERTKGGMKNLANTLNGMFSTTAGMLKSTVGKLVGVTDDGYIITGSLMDRVKEKFDNLNKKMQSPETQKALDEWAKGLADAMPRIIELINSIKKKLVGLAGENFMERLNNSINKFDPKNFNKALDEVQKKIDKITDRAIRLGGAFMGMQLAKINPYLGAVAMVGGAFAPELIDAGKKAAEFLEPTFDYHKRRKEMIEKLELENEKIPVCISGASEEMNKYLDDYLKGKTQNTGVEWFSRADRVKEKIENVKTENQILNDYARENVIINNNNDNRVFNTTNNNYTENKNHSKSNNNYISSDSRKIYNSESNRIDNSKSITNSEINNNSFSSQKNIDNSKSSVSNNDLSKIYNSKTETNDNSKVYNNTGIKEKEIKKTEVPKVFIDNRANINITVPAGTDKVALNELSKDILRKIEEITDKRINKTFENMTTEIEFA